jgi:hypothetical protein
VILVEIPGRGEVTWDGPHDVMVVVDLGVQIGLMDAGSRGVRKLREVEDRFEADVRRVLSQPAYSPDAFDSDGEWRLLPGTAAHARAALLSLNPGAEIVVDDEDEVEAALGAVGAPAEGRSAGR